MATNKVIYAGNTLIDLSSDTITASDLLQGVVAHDKAGNTITGTLTVPEKQEKTVNDLLLVHGNQTIVPDVGKTLSKVIINKPDTLIAENVKKDVTIAGVVGTLEPTLQEKTVTPRTSAQTITPDTDYDGLSQVTIEAIPTVTQATPSITVDSMGLITASTTQSEGYVTSGTKSATRQLTKQLGKTVTPGTSNVVAVESGKYTTGTVYVKGDSNLTADNIKSGTSIFGVTGSYVGSSPKLQSKSVTYTSNGTATITPDAGYDAMSSVDVTVNVSGGYNLKKVTYQPSVNKMLKDITITHNCGSIPKFVMVMSNNSDPTTAYLRVGSGANESQSTSFLMVINTGQATASVTSATFTYRNAGSTRYFRGTIYTYYFFY